MSEQSNPVCADDMYQTSQQLTPAQVIAAYRRGFFPMAEPDGTIFWHFPAVRAVFLPELGMKISRSLRQTLRKNLYEVRFNTAFADVIAGCADREETWISPEIIRVYTELHQMGYVHSVESWHQGELVGGLYGVTIGGVFFGESMFTRMRDASKVAFVALMERLRERSFVLLDSQYPNHHTLSLGAHLVSSEEFQLLLAYGLQRQCQFP